MSEHQSNLTEAIWALETTRDMLHSEDPDVRKYAESIAGVIHEVISKIRSRELERRYYESS